MHKALRRLHRWLGLATAVFLFIAGATGGGKTVTLKLVGYTAAINALLPHLTEDASIVLFGGLAKERPYPGSTTVTSINGAVSTMVHTLALELLNK